MLKFHDPSDPKLFEYIFCVTLKEDNTFTNEVFYPSSKSELPTTLSNVGIFCFHSISRTRTPRDSSFSFCLTDSDKNPLFLFVTIRNRKHSFCVASRYYHERFLSNLTYAISNIENKTKYLELITSGKFFHEKKDWHFSSTVPEKQNLGLKSTDHMSEDCEIMNLYMFLFSILPVHYILLLVVAIILDNKIVVISSKIELLNKACLSLLSLIHPLSWPGSFIPICPADMSTCLEAPFPYIIGIHSSLSEKLLSDSLQCYFAFNVDGHYATNVGQEDFPGFILDYVDVVSEKIKNILKSFQPIFPFKLIQREIRNFLKGTMALTYDLDPNDFVYKEIIANYYTWRDEISTEFKALISQGQFVDQFVRAIDSNEAVESVFNAFFPGEMFMPQVHLPMAQIEKRFPSVNIIDNINPSKKDEKTVMFALPNDNNGGKVNKDNKGNTTKVANNSNDANFANNLNNANIANDETKDNKDAKENDANGEEGQSLGKRPRRKSIPPKLDEKRKVVVNNEESIENEEELDTQSGISKIKLSFNSLGGKVITSSDEESNEKNGGEKIKTKNKKRKNQDKNKDNKSKNATFVQENDISDGISKDLEAAKTRSITKKDNIKNKNSSKEKNKNNDKDISNSENKKSKNHNNDNSNPENEHSNINENETKNESNEKGKKKTEKSKSRGDLGDDKDIKKISKKYRNRSPRFHSVYNPKDIDQSLTSSQDKDQSSDGHHHRHRHHHHRSIQIEEEKISSLITSSKLINDNDNSENSNSSTSSSSAKKQKKMAPPIDNSLISQDQKQPADEKINYKEKIEEKKPEMPIKIHLPEGECPIHKKRIKAPPIITNNSSSSSEQAEDNISPKRKISNNNSKKTQKSSNDAMGDFKDNSKSVDKINKKEITNEKETKTEKAKEKEIEKEIVKGNKKELTKLNLQKYNNDSSDVFKSESPLKKSNKPPLPRRSSNSSRPNYIPMQKGKNTSLKNIFERGIDDNDDNKSDTDYSSDDGDLRSKRSLRRFPDSDQPYKRSNYNSDSDNLSPRQIKKKSPNDKARVNIQLTPEFDEDDTDSEDRYNKDIKHSSSNKRNIQKSKSSNNNRLINKSQNSNYNNDNGNKKENIVQPPKKQKRAPPPLLNFENDSSSSPSSPVYSHSQSARAYKIIPKIKETSEEEKKRRRRSDALKKTTSHDNDSDSDSNDSSEKTNSASFVRKKTTKHQFIPLLNYGEKKNDNNSKKTKKQSFSESEGQLSESRVEKESERKELDEDDLHINRPAVKKISSANRIIDQHCFDNDENSNIRDEIAKVKKNEEGSDERHEKSISYSSSFEYNEKNQANNKLFERNRNGKVYGKSENDFVSNEKEKKKKKKAAKNNTNKDGILVISDSSDTENKKVVEKRKYSKDNDSDDISPLVPSSSKSSAKTSQKKQLKARNNAEDNEFSSEYENEKDNIDINKKNKFKRKRFISNANEDSSSSSSTTSSEKNENDTESYSSSSSKQRKGRKNKRKKELDEEEENKKENKKENIKYHKNEKQRNSSNKYIQEDDLASNDGSIDEPSVKKKVIRVPPPKLSPRNSK